MTKAGFKKIIGVDEVGRGALAGPIVVGAVELSLEIPGITDSKLIVKSDRLPLAELIKRSAEQIGIGQVSHEEIDEFGVTTALHLAYARALEKLEVDLVLSDNFPLQTGHRYIRIIKGDQLFYPTAAASIIAKVYRDQLMRVYDRFFPEYDWFNNVGYGTAKHKKAIDSIGFSPLHRQSFLK